MLNNFLKPAVNNWNFLFVFLIFAILLLAFLDFSGTLTSGYHFIDDHEMLVIHSDLKNTSVIQTMTKWISQDLNIRFRPMYYIHRVLEMKIFGDNFFYLSIYTGLLAALTFSLFYLGSRYLRVSVIGSLLLVFLSFIGSQAAIWWRLGPAETIGMVFLGLAFFFMARCAVSNLHYCRNSVLFTIFLVFASLCKESFVIIVPAFILYKIWNEKMAFNISIKEAIKKNYLSLIPFAIMLLELWLIVFKIGTNKIGYAGSTYNINELLDGIRNILMSKNMLGDWLRLVIIIAIIYIVQIIFLWLKKMISRRKSILNILAPFFFSFLIIIPNLVLNAKSGMTERYLLPTTFGLAFLIVSLIQNTRPRFLRFALYLICIVFLFYPFKTTISNAKAFSVEGKQTNELLSGIVKNNSTKSKILLVADPVDRYEVSYSLNIYLKSKGINQLYGFPVMRIYNSDFKRGLKEGWLNWFKGKTINDIGCKPDMIVIIDKNQTEEFFKQSKLSRSKYKNLLSDDNQFSLYTLR